jgi:hypothetical protein
VQQFLRFTDRETDLKRESVREREREREREEGEGEKEIEKEHVRD